MPWAILAASKPVRGKPSNVQTVCSKKTEGVEGRCKIWKKSGPCVILYPNVIQGGPDTTKKVDKGGGGVADQDACHTCWDISYWGLRRNWPEIKKKGGGVGKSGNFFGGERITTPRENPENEKKQKREEWSWDEWDPGGGGNGLNPKENV